MSKKIETRIIGIEGIANEGSRDFCHVVLELKNPQEDAVYLREAKPFSDVTVTVDTPEVENPFDALIKLFGGAVVGESKEMADSCDKCVCTPEYDCEPGIVGIWANEKKRVVTVKFMDGDVIVQRCCPDDAFDVSVGVALACMQKWFGSKTAFKRFVKNTAKVITAPVEEAPAEPKSEGKKVAKKRTTKKSTKKAA